MPKNNALEAFLNKIEADILKQFGSNSIEAIFANGSNNDEVGRSVKTVFLLTKLYECKFNCPDKSKAMIFSIMLTHSLKHFTNFGKEAVVTFLNSILNKVKEYDALCQVISQQAENKVN